MRSNELYLSDIVQAADSIAQFVADMDEEQFVGDRTKIGVRLAFFRQAWDRSLPEPPPMPRDK